MQDSQAAIDRMCSANTIHCEDKYRHAGEKSKYNPDELVSVISVFNGVERRLV